MTIINKKYFQNYNIKKNTQKKNDHENWYQSKTHHLK